MTELKFNIDNQEEQMRILENLTSDLNLSLKFRLRLLSLPYKALHIANCDKECLVRLNDSSMDIIVSGNLSKNQLDHINLYTGSTYEYEISRLKEDWKNNISNRDESWKELIDINECLRPILRVKGKIKLENNPNKSELKFSIPWIKNTHQKIVKCILH